MGRRITICREEGCKDAATTGGYCRLHYLKNWRRIKREKRARAAKRLNAYVERLIRKNPEGYLDDIRRDLREGRVEELNFDEGGEVLLDEAAYDEELDEILKELKIEKGY